MCINGRFSKIQSHISYITILNSCIARTVGFSDTFPSPSIIMDLEGGWAGRGCMGWEFKAGRD